MSVGMNSNTVESIKPGVIVMLDAMAGATESSQTLWAQQRPDEPKEDEKQLEEEHERRKEEEEEDWYD